MNQYFQKLHKHIKRLEVNNGVLYRKYFDQTGLESHKQIVVPENSMIDIIKKLHNNTTQGHPGSKKMLHEIRKRYYSINLAVKVQQVRDSCKWCTHTKRVDDSKLKPPLQKIYEPSNGPEDLMEIDIVGPLPNSNGSTHILTGKNVFSRYLFAVPLRKTDINAVVRALMSIFLKHAYVRKHIITVKGTVFTAELLNQLMETAGIKISHATINHAQTIGIVERSHAKLKKYILKINVNVDKPQWDKYVDIAIMAHNTTYHTAIK